MVAHMLPAVVLSQALMMDAGTLSPGITSDPKAWNRAKWFTETTVHLTSLLHGVALQHLRNDWDLANLTTYHSIDPAPPLVRRLLCLLLSLWRSQLPECTYIPVCLGKLPEPLDFQLLTPL